MNLENQIKAIASDHKIPGSSLILKELELFSEEHKFHGDYRLIVEYGRGSGKVNYIAVRCTAGELVHVGICSHHFPDPDRWNQESIIYSSSKKETMELKQQRERRERILEH